MKTRTYLVTSIGTVGLSFVVIYFVMIRLLLIPQNATIVILVPTLLVMVPVLIPAIVQGQRKCSDASTAKRLPIILINEMAKIIFIAICTATLSLLALGSLIYDSNKYIGLSWCALASGAALYLGRRTVRFNERVKEFENA